MTCLEQTKHTTWAQELLNNWEAWRLILSWFGAGLLQQPLASSPLTESTMSSVSEGAWGKWETICPKAKAEMDHAAWQWPQTFQYIHQGMSRKKIMETSGMAKPKLGSYWDAVWWFEMGCACQKPLRHHAERILDRRMGRRKHQSEDISANIGKYQLLV